jgi:hypothetical protein
MLDFKIISDDCRNIHDDQKCLMPHLFIFSTESDGERQLFDIQPYGIASP